MLLGEALDEIGRLRQQIPELASRAQRSARYQDGETPAEDAQRILTALRQALARQEYLTAKITLTNSTAEVEPGQTISQAIARRRHLLALNSQLGSLADAAAGGQRDPLWDRRRRSELIEKTDLDVTALRDEAAEVAKEAAALNATLQRANWAVDLAELN